MGMLCYSEYILHWHTCVGRVVNERDIAFGGWTGSMMESLLIFVANVCASQVKPTQLIITSAMTKLRL